MRNYEMFLIVNPEIDETAVNSVVEKVKGWITDAGGNVIKVDLWGKRRMAYHIRKQREGQYVYIQADFAPTFSNELERNLRFLEPVMRFLITNISNN